MVFAVLGASMVCAVYCLALNILENSLWKISQTAHVTLPNWAFCDFKKKESQIVLCCVKTYFA